MKSLILFFLLILFYNSQLFAHQPKLIKNSPSQNNPYIIFNPEISKAFYGILDGKPHWYKISSDNNFLFYSGILSPKINESYNWFSVDVLDNNLSLLYKADGENFNWTSWYEPYAQDYYWKGPEIGIDANAEFKTSFQVDSGIYFIKVYNATNTGSYSLAVGEAEFFGSNFYEKTLTWIPILFYIAPFRYCFLNLCSYGLSSRKFHNWTKVCFCI